MQKIKITQKSIKEERYRIEDKKICIDVQVKNYRQLFDYRDPAPFLERDLDDDFVEYVLASAQSFSLHREFKIVIHIAETNADMPEDELKKAIGSFFSYEAIMERKHLTRTMKETRRFLFFGFVLLVLCLTAADFAGRSQVPFLNSVLREGLAVGGWVALWRPLDSLLYDWWPTYLRIRYLRKLSESEIAFH